MNTDHKKENPSATGKKLLPGQFDSMDKRIQSQLPKKPGE